ncbi:HesA/MoeB/ThiF family protein [Rathayibacter tanaceti]|uniref:Adenylyltransferase/sulfurtransferase MoeZ n=2 Tax=Rathayibacter tanaceti TaxID=1671680 RepID=A0A162GEQ6_9MICO|nr:HesA/MoeB/ThiF family protein [Rathayibacter tanaceti]KZX19959.1 putative adenylyltransferase/sulfurtransferase MoeZ [Rathayibacter tanaceti]QHC55647.1 adenylyltransferase/sulfurtransferase MoeZ [Rathayibacter tanaceti]TCO39552.1 adenylyltransferase/sulfurtransferase [Rathayibacter tanaceti]
MPLPIEPGPPLTAAERERYARQIRLGPIGELGQRRLRNARVLVLGAGGIGSPVITALAAAGVGRLGIVDADVVEVSNLARQTAHDDSWVGLSKAESAAATARRLSPGIDVRAFPVSLTRATADDLIAGWDIVVDGFDTFGARYLASDATTRAGVPHVWGSALGFDGQLSTFWSQAPGGGVTLRALHPEAEDAADSCATVGVLGALCATIGSAMAAEVVKLVTGVGSPLFGRVLVHDALDGSWGELPLARRVPPIGVAPPGAVAAGAVSAAELRERLAGPTPPTVVDLREDDEDRSVAVPGAVRMPMSRFDPRALPDGPLVLHCASGTRSRLAAERAAAAGVAAESLTGGMAGWRR